MSKRRVVVTGLGIVSPVGIGAKDVWASLLAGKSGVGPITKFDASNLVMGPTPLLPASRLAQTSFAPIPTGETIPRPVTTTLRLLIQG